MEETVKLDLIESRIFTIRGVQVMMDRDLANLYGVETRIINQVRKRNLERFPESFCFQLTKEEYDFAISILRSQIVTSNEEENSLKSQIVTLDEEKLSSRSQIATLNGENRFSRSQIVTLNGENTSLRSQIVMSNEETSLLKSQIATSKFDIDETRGGRRYLPYVFTEQGVAMLSSVLRSEVAVKVSVQIMNAFVQMRHFLSANGSLYVRLDSVEKRQIETDEKLNKNLLQMHEKLDSHEKKFEKVFEALEAADLPKQGVFCNGQIFDAYNFASDLIRKAKSSIVIVDNYVDDTVLAMLDKRKAGVSATIYTQSISKKLSLDLQKHNAQYSAIDVRTVSNVHDRFLFLDEKTIYHIGVSLKDLGKKVFGFTRLELPAKNIMNMLGVVV